METNDVIKKYFAFVLFPQSIFKYLHVLFSAYILKPEQRIAMNRRNEREKQKRLPNKSSKLQNRSRLFKS